MNNTLNDYQAAAMGVRLEKADAAYAILGFVGEVGEVYSLAAKAIRDGKKFDYDQNIKKKLGGVLWFIAAIAADNGFTLEDVARSNIESLLNQQEDSKLQSSGDDR